MPVAVLAAAAAISVVITVLRPAPLKLEAPDTAVAVKTLTLYSQSADLLVESQGTVLPRTRTQLISEVSGAVLTVSPQFVVGGTFKAGDVLLQLDPTDYEVALQRAEARLISMNAQATFELARATQAQKEWAMTGRPTSEAPLLALREPYLAEARANVLQAEAEVKQAKLKLARTTIRAPYLGMVSAKTVDIGRYVTVATPLGEIFAIDSAEVRLPLTEKDLARIDLIRRGDSTELPAVTLRATVASTPVQWAAKVVRSEGVVDQLNRSQYLVAQIDDPYAVLSDSAGNGSPLLMGTFGFDGKKKGAKKLTKKQKKAAKRSIDLQQTMMSRNVPTVKHRLNKQSSIKTEVALPRYYSNTSTSKESATRRETVREQRSNISLLPSNITVINQQEQ